MKIFGIRNKKDIKKLISNHQVQVAVYGLGKMGLPLACVMAERGFQVTGVDINVETVEKVNNGDNPIVDEESLDSLLKKVIKKKRLTATNDGVAAAKTADVALVIVPTFLKNKKPELKTIETVARVIGKGLQKDTLVILESTVPPGITRGLFKLILEKESGLKAGRDFGLAFCPERTSSGTAISDIRGRLNPKIVGGIERKSGLAAAAIYERINKMGVILVSNLEIAEVVKIAETVYRDVKIAYANSLALFCDELKIDAEEVIKAANTESNCDILRPGPGVGGHCIPVYPYFVFDKVKKKTELLKSARKINDSMASYTVKLIKDVLQEEKKSLKESNILILGITYRGNVKEVRLSPALDVYRLLKKRVKKVFVFDPLYEREEIEKIGLNFKDDYQGIDCLVITALHDSFKKLNFAKTGKEMRTKTLVDTTFYFDPEKFKKEGFKIRSIGHYFRKKDD
jgi:nucleotide sugar dehydrogenase